MASTDTTATSLGAAVAAIDFTNTNIELARLDAECALLYTKAAEAEAEALRLAGVIRDWSGPDPEALADDMMDGQAPGEVALATTSREQLVEQRHAMLATAGALRDRQERARQERDEVAQRQCLMIAEAAQPFLAATIEEQKRAAKAILDADATLQALHWVTGVHIAGNWASQTARRAVTGMDSLIGPIARLPVPADVVAALSPLADRCKGLRAAVPETVSNQ